MRESVFITSARITWVSLYLHSMPIYITKSWLTLAWWAVLPIVFEATQPPCIFISLNVKIIMQLAYFCILGHCENPALFSMLAIYIPCINKKENVYTYYSIGYTWDIHRQIKYTLIRQVLRSCLVRVYFFSKRRHTASSGLGG